jgi:3-hydroxyisobutyrate dehydrogenase-like beta-hydroxyacid dehydrogenase
VGYFDAPVLGHLANAKKKHITTLISGIGIRIESQGLKPAFLKILQNGITKIPT